VPAVNRPKTLQNQQGFSRFGRPKSAPIVHRKHAGTVPLPHRCRAASATKPGCARNDPSANAAQDVLALDDAIKLHRSPNQLKPFDETDRFIIVRDARSNWEMGRTLQCQS
jgi:hypothetical protein